MRLLSSIFSFKTLQWRGGIPRAWTLALILYFFLNVLVVIGKRSEILFTGMPEVQVKDFIESVQQPKDLWLIGNSLLAFGVDSGSLKSGSNISFSRISIGSGTFEAMSALAQLALSKTQAPPEVILVFVSKDDFNLNGRRQVASQRYLKSIESPQWTALLASRIPLYACRASLFIGPARWLKDQFLRFSTRPPTMTTQESKPAKSYLNADESLIAEHVESNYLIPLGNDFELNTAGFDDLGQATKPSSTRVVVIFPPVSSAVPIWQARHNPTNPWPDVRHDIESLAFKNGFDVMDFSTAFPTNKHYFRDPYHLTDAGKIEFTKLLKEWLASSFSVPQ